jgi:hypothetical protein
MSSIRFITKLINHGFYVAAAALLLAGLVLTAAPEPALADPSTALPGICSPSRMRAIPQPRFASLRK